MKNWLIWKDPDAGKDWRLEEKGTTEDEMVRWVTKSMDVSLSKLWEWTRKPDVLQSMELQRVRHNWVTELNWTETWLYAVFVFKLLSCVWLFATPWTLACKAPLPKNTGMGCPSVLQEIFLTQGSNPHFIMSPVLAGGFFTTNATLLNFLKYIYI